MQLNQWSTEPSQLDILYTYGINLKTVCKIKQATSSPCILYMSI